MELEIGRRNYNIDNNINNEVLVMCAGVDASLSYDHNLYRDLICEALSRYLTFTLGRL